MERFINMITGHKKGVIAVFIAAVLLSAVLMPIVTINYDMADYLSEDAGSTAAIRIMREEFGEFPNARVMISGVSLREALVYKEELANISGVASVTWLDDVVGPDILATTPIEYLDASIVGSYYKAGSALYSVSIESGKEESTVDAIYMLAGEKVAVAGDAVNTASLQKMSYSEVIKALAILLPVIIIILILATSSWAEPLLFLMSIGAAVLINMGTNAFFGEISFVTQAVSPILQLAVSLDYAIFLLHSFNDFRMTSEPHEAMRLAVKKAMPTIAASAATTVVGFAALLFMRFGIGSDLGINLIKGVALSFFSVVVFLPALTLACYKLIDKTRHRRFMPELRGVGSRLIKIRIPALVIALIVVIPAFLAQSNLEFKYGAGYADTSREGQDAALIEERFGRQNQLVLLVPKGEPGKESELCEKLSEIRYVTGVTAYAALIGPEIPPEYIQSEIVGQFYSENYARIIVSTDTEYEGEPAFKTVEAVADAVSRYYPRHYLAGQSVALYDMKSSVSVDTGVVNAIAIVGIFIVLLLTFRSLAVPLILLFVIESAIWINLSIAYFSGQAFNFLGYLVISTVQLGATVDYAILLADRYLSHRKELPKTDAMKAAVGGNLVAVLTSAAILATAGFTLAATSSNTIVAELGLLLGRGTALSFIMAVCVLPAMLLLFDKVIQKTSLDNYIKRRTPK